MRYSRVPRPGSHQKYRYIFSMGMRTLQLIIPRPRHPGRLVGFWHSDLRIPRRPATILGSKSYENLRTVRLAQPHLPPIPQTLTITHQNRRRQDPLPVRHVRRCTRHHLRALHSGRIKTTRQRQRRRSGSEIASVVQEYRLERIIPPRNARTHHPTSEGSSRHAKL